MSLNRTHGLIALPILIALGLGAGLALYFSRNLEQNRYRLLHTYQVMDSARALLAEVQEAQMAQRDYLLYRQERRLARYNETVGKLPGILARLGSLTTDN